MLFSDCSELNEVEYTGTNHSVVNPGIRASKAQPRCQEMNLELNQGSLWVKSLSSNGRREMYVLDDGSGKPQEQSHQPEQLVTQIVSLPTLQETESSTHFYLIFFTVASRGKVRSLEKRGKAQKNRELFHFIISLGCKWRAQMPPPLPKPIPSPPWIWPERQEKRTKFSFYKNFFSTWPWHVTPTVSPHPLVLQKDTAQVYLLMAVDLERVKKSMCPYSLFLVYHACY